VSKEVLAGHGQRKAWRELSSPKRPAINARSAFLDE
jgi:hypothetical protein